MNDYKIAVADPAARREEIVGLLLRNLNRQSEQRFEWNYLRGPFGPAVTWLASGPAAPDAIGTISVFPRRLRLAGREVDAGVIGDFAVDHAYRGFGPALLLQNAMKRGHRAAGRELVYGVPNKQSEPVVLRSGMEIVGPVRRWVRPLRAEVQAGRWLPPAAVTRRLRFVIDAWLALRSRPARREDGAGYGVECPETSDPRLERLWRRATAEFPVAGARPREFLAWRYGRSPVQEFRTFALSDRDGELRGGLVWFEKNGSADIVDLAWRPEPGAGEALLGEFARHARALGLGAMAVSYLGRPEVERTLKRARFHLHDRGAWNLVVGCESPEDRALLLDPTNWHFVMGDNDA